MVKQRKGVIKEEMIMPMKTVEPKSHVPTPEQMRIAQILEKRVVDSNIKLQLKQIMDATQRSADEVYVALHDSDFDVNRAVNLLIEGEDQMADWCLSEKRKKKLADSKEKKEEVVEAEATQPENKNSSKGKSEIHRTGRGQIKGQIQQSKPQQGESRRPLGSNESRAPKVKQGAKYQGGTYGFGSMVFERSNPPPINTNFLPPVRNQWEKPLTRMNGPEDDWDSEEFQGSLSQTQIFTSSKKFEPKENMEEQKTPKASSPRPVTSLPSLTYTNRDQYYSSSVYPSTCQKKNEDITPASRQERSVPLLANVKTSQDMPCNIPSQDRPKVQPSQDKPTPVPAQSRAEYGYRCNYSKSSHHEDKRPPSKIPTLPVEMPPELKPSLSFLDIQFGAMDLLPLETSSESQTYLCKAPSLNPTLMPPTTTPSSCSIDFEANSNILSSNTSVIAYTSANCSPLPSTACTTSPGICSTTTTPGMNGKSSPPGISGLPSSNNIPTPVISSINNSVSTVVNHSLNSIVNTSLNSIANPNMNTSNGIQPANLAPSNNISGSISHLMGQSNVQQTGANITTANNLPNTNHMLSNTINYGSSSNQRFLPSSQAFNSSHMQYGIINPPVTSHAYDSRDNAPPPHLPQPHAHLPPFKSPQGVPKGAMVPNLPTGSLMSNQYIVGQGNIPYFAHQPLYYYEEMPSIMNSQQRLTNMTSHPHHFDVAYQAAPSSRDSVHYNA